MRKIQYFDQEMNVEEFVKMQICKNAGTQSIAFKNDLIRRCEEDKLEYDKNMTKDELYVLLVQSGISPEIMAFEYGVGVSSQDFQKEFGISHLDVKRLEKHKALSVVGSYRFRAFGTYNYAPLYDVYQFCRMTDDDMQQLLRKYPKGKRVQKKNK